MLHCFTQNMNGMNYIQLWVKSNHKLVWKLRMEISFHAKTFVFLSVLFYNFAFRYSTSQYNTFSCIIFRDKKCDQCENKSSLYNCTSSYAPVLYTWQYIKNHSADARIGIETSMY